MHKAAETARVGADLDPGAIDEGGVALKPARLLCSAESDLAAACVCDDGEPGG